MTIGRICAEAEASRNWGPSACKAALGLLHELSREHRRLAALRTAAAGEAPPVLPMFRRCADAEALPRFLHGAEGAIARVNSDLGVAEGSGCSSLGGTGVGAELVLQWWVGEEAPEGVAQGLAVAEALPVWAAEPVSVRVGDSVPVTLLQTLSVSVADTVPLLLPVLLAEALPLSVPEVLPVTEGVRVSDEVAQPLALVQEPLRWQQPVLAEPLH
jgi:hypothetical protein